MNESSNISGLDLLFLEVNSLEDSLSFYSDVLALPIEKSSPEGDPPMATLRAGSLRITLAQQPETMLRRGRGTHFFLGVLDVDDYYRHLRERGADVQPPLDEGWGGRYITLQDPDKYRYFFVSWSEAKGKPAGETYGPSADRESISKT